MYPVVEKASIASLVAALAPATVAGANAATKLAIEAFSTSGYAGTIFVDEIDLQ